MQRQKVHQYAFASLQLQCKLSILWMLRVVYKSPMHFTSLLSSIILPICNYIVRFFLDILIGFLYTKVAKNAIKVRRGGNIFPRFFFQIYVCRVQFPTKCKIQNLCDCVHLAKKVSSTAVLCFSPQGHLSSQTLLFCSRGKAFSHIIMQINKMKLKQTFFACLLPFMC